MAKELVYEPHKESLEKIESIIEGIREALDKVDSVLINIADDSINDSKND